MYYTYVLLCEDIKRDRRTLYVGSTEDVRARFADHKAGKVKTTKGFGTLGLVYYEACRDKTYARKRELQLKTGFGRGYIKKRIESDLKNAGMV